MSAPVDHPPPWAWTGVDDGVIRNGPQAGQPYYDALDLVDACGAEVMSCTNSNVNQFVDAGVRELLRAAPEMADLLRRLADISADGDQVMDCAGWIVDVADEARALLTRIDAARKVGD